MNKKIAGILSSLSLAVVLAGVSRTTNETAAMPDESDVFMPQLFQIFDSAACTKDDYKALGIFYINPSITDMITKNAENLPVDTVQKAVDESWKTMASQLNSSDFPRRTAPGQPAVVAGPSRDSRPRRRRPDLR